MSTRGTRMFSWLTNGFLAIICLCLWNTILGYVLAYCATGEKHTNV